MITDFVNTINDSLKPLFEAWPGGVFYGITQSVIRKVGTEEELLPCLVDKTGESRYIGIDDTHPIILYHKINNMVPAIKPGGFGDNAGDQANTYQLSMIIFYDREKLNLLPEDLILYIQANFPDSVISAPYKNNIIRFTGAVLNTRAVFSEEYQNTDFTLPANKSLFKINYSIESIFKKGCFKKCPC